MKNSESEESLAVGCTRFCVLHLIFPRMPQPAPLSDRLASTPHFGASPLMYHPSVRAPASATDDKTQTVASYKRRAPAAAAAPFSASNLQAAVHHKAAKAKKSTKKSKPVGQGEQPEPNAEEQPAAAGAGAGAASCLTLRTRTRRWAELARHPRAPLPCPAGAESSEF